MRKMTFAIVSHDAEHSLRDHLEPVTFQLVTSAVCDR